MAYPGKFKQALSSDSLRGTSKLRERPFATTILEDTPPLGRGLPTKLRPRSAFCVGSSVDVSAWLDISWHNSILLREDSSTSFMLMCSRSHCTGVPLLTSTSANGGIAEVGGIDM